MRRCAPSASLPATASARLVVDGFYRAAKNRRMHHAGIQHSVHARVLPVHPFARRTYPSSRKAAIFADVSPLAARLQFHFFFFGNFQFRRRCRQFAVAELLARRCVHHFVQSGRALRHRLAPLRRGRSAPASVAPCRPLRAAERKNSSPSASRRYPDRHIFHRRSPAPFSRAPSRRPVHPPRCAAGRSAAAAHLRAVRDHVHGSVRINRQINTGVQRGIGHGG